MPKRIKRIKRVKKARVSKRSPALIKVVGVGGGGGNAISRMRDEFIKGVEFIAINTDLQDLEYCNAHKKLHIGKNVTRGLGAGMNPELGRLAAEENRAEIAESLKGADLVFVTAGYGGGTGSSASIVTAEIARELGALVVAVVTKPFGFEGGQRMKIAQEALAKIKDQVDALIVIPNDRIFNIISRDTSINKAFEAIDSVLKNAVQGIADLITMPGIINVDFADVRAVMRSAGTAIVGIGFGSGKERAASAVQQAINSPLIESTIDGARGVLFGVSGGRDLKMNEINEIAKTITDLVDPSAKIIFGSYYDRKIKTGQLKVTLIATSFTEEAGQRLEPTMATTLFGEKVEVRPEILVREPAVERPMPTLSHKAPEPMSLKTAAPALAIPSTSETVQPVSTKLSKSLRRETNPGKKVTDIWDIPTFLRKRKK